MRLSGLLITFQERVAYTKGLKLKYLEFLELVLQNKIQRREQGSLTKRLKQNSLNLDQTLERFDRDAKVSVDRDILKKLFGLRFMERGKNVIFCVPVGVGKTFLANALAHSALRQGKKALMMRAQKIFKKTCVKAEADNSSERELMRYIAPELLVFEDSGPQKLSPQEVNDFYEIVIERHGRASIIITSNRHVD